MITYPEMNEKIKELLKFEGSPNALYALARIEQLEKELAASRRQLSAVPSEERIREMSKEFVEVIEVYLDATDREEVLRRAEDLINAIVRELK